MAPLRAVLRNPPGSIGGRQPAYPTMRSHVVVVVATEPQHRAGMLATRSSSRRSAQTYLIKNTTVMLVAHNGRKMEVTATVKKLTKMGMSPSIKLVDKVPTTLLTRVSQHDAEEARRKLTAAGAIVEIR